MLASKEHRSIPSRFFTTWHVGQQNSIFINFIFIFIFENFEIIHRLPKFAVYGILSDATALFIVLINSPYTGYGWMQRLFFDLTVTTGFGYRFDAVIYDLSLFSFVWV